MKYGQHNGAVDSIAASQLYGWICDLDQDEWMNEYEILFINILKIHSGYVVLSLYSVGAQSVLKKLASVKEKTYGDIRSFSPKAQ